MVWVLYRFIAALVWLLPLFVARLLMGRFFALLGPFSIRANNRMDRSLTVAFPFRDERWRKERRLRTWVNLGKSVADSMKTKAVQRRLQTHVTYRLQPELASLQQDPRGQLLLMGHMGAWEVAVQIVPKLGRKVMGVHRPLDNPRIEAELQKSRQLAGIEMVSIEDRLLVRKGIRHLQAGGMLAIFVDQRWARGEMLDLFEQPALTTLSPGLFQLSTDARVSTLICRRDGLSHFEAILEPLPFKAQDDDTWRQRGRSIMRAFHGRLEDWVRVHPDDWYWLQDRWKP
jgi:KDO2-lipid IV(A) lauroyltransferase